MSRRELGGNADISLATLHASNHATPSITQHCLESKRCEEPLVLTGLKCQSRVPKNIKYLELLLKILLDNLLCFLPLTHLLQTIITHLRLQLLNSVKGVSSRHKVIIVYEFYERLYFTSFRNSLLSHSCGDFARITLDSGYESMTKGMAFGTVVKGFKNDCFSASVTTASDEGDLAGFQD